MAIALLLGVCGAGALAAGFVSARPARFFDVTAREIEFSMAPHTDGAVSQSGASCNRRGDVWYCHDVFDSDSPVMYRLRMRSKGCWSARVIEDENVRIHDSYGLGRVPRRISDCIGILDYVRFWDRLLGG